MDSDSWARMYNYARRHQSRSDVYRGEECDVDEEVRPEFLCPFCAEEFDVVGLCCHIDDEHAFKATNGACPVCAKKVGSDLVRHLTVQHANMLKVQRRRRYRKGGSNFSFSMLRKELGEEKLQSLLGGSSFSTHSSHDKPDPLLTSFMQNLRVVDEPPSVQLVPAFEACSMGGSTVKDPTNRVGEESKMSDEDQKEKARKSEFAQGILLSTFLDDNL